MHSECRHFLVRLASFVLGGIGGILAQVPREALADVPAGIELALLQCHLQRSQVFVIGSACLFVMQVLELLLCRSNKNTLVIDHDIDHDRAR